MRYRNSTHIRLDDATHERITDAATRWYRGNRTDLIRDAIVCHLDALYTGRTTPSPADPKPVAIVREGVDEGANIW